MIYVKESKIFNSEEYSRKRYIKELKEEEERKDKKRLDEVKKRVDSLKK